MALLDLTKAYDTVWRQRIHNTLIEKGPSSRYVLWPSSFLGNDKRLSVSIEISAAAVKFIIKNFHRALSQHHLYLSCILTAWTKLQRFRANTGHTQQETKKPTNSSVKLLTMYANEQQCTMYANEQQCTLTMYANEQQEGR